MKTRKNYSLGSLCVAAGCALRVLQLVTAYMGLGLSSNRIVYMAMLCLLVGGFAVLIYEKGYLFYFVGENPESALSFFRNKL